MTKIIYQVFIGVVCNLLILDTGASDAWPTQILRDFNGEDPYLLLTSAQQVWVVNAMYIAMALAAALPFLLLNKCGLKQLMILSTIPKLCSWLMVGLSREYWLLLLGRFMAGIGYSIDCLVVPLYLGEVISKTIRGPIGTLPCFSYYFGALLINTGGAWLDRKTVSFALVPIPLAFALLSYWLPISPRYLIKQNQLPQAKEVLIALGEDNVEQRIEEIQQKLNHESASAKVTLRESWKNPCVKKSFCFSAMIVLGDFGCIPISAFVSFIYKQSVSNVDLWIILSTVIPVLFVISCSGLVKYTGKRKIYLPATAMIFLTEFSIAVFYTLQSRHVNVEKFRLLPAILVTVYLACSGVYSSMSMGYAGELFPYQVKSVGTFFSPLLTASCSAFSVKMHEVTQRTIGQSAPYYIYSLMALVFGSILHFTLIETEGKTLEEIQDELLSNSKSKFKIKK